MPLVLSVALLSAQAAFAAPAELFTKNCAGNVDGSCPQRIAIAVSTRTQTHHLFSVCSPSQSDLSQLKCITSVRRRQIYHKLSAKSC